ncbi:MAG: ABC transporter ATP-binding protein [Alphaproteobacteria bacterium]|nr:ABC transporter ATP-binding protein [Alphaproteobacteria bacterium]
MPDPSKSSSPVMELRDVCHSYGSTPSVQGLNLKVNSGEVVCLLGPSGCGKTTALRIAAGLEPVTDGQVLLDGVPVSKKGQMVPPENRNLGLVFQDYALFPHMTIAENIGFGLTDKANASARVEAVLKQVGMTDYARAYPHELSGGQQQRVALARALAPEPHGILMDEPFSGLDARLRESVRDRTLHILKESGAAVLMVTHDAEEAMHMADRIVVMRDGHVEQEGSPDTLYLSPRNGFVAGFFGDVNKIKVQVENGQAATPLGIFSAGTLNDGDSVDVVIRPEALKLSTVSPDHPAQVKVLAARMLGRTSLIHLCTCATSDQAVHLHARMPGRYLPDEGELQSVHLDRSQVFVFPSEGAT